LGVGGRVALARIGAGHEISVLVCRFDLEDGDAFAGRIEIGFFARQTLERLAGGRFVSLFGIEKSEHRVKGSVFQHQDDDVLDSREWIAASHINSR
jgi:hypothetical protein